MKCFSICLQLSVMLILSSTATGQPSEGDIVISEFFEDLFLVDPASGALTDIFDDAANSARPENVVIRNGEIFATDSDGLFRFNPLTNTAVQVAQLPSAPSEIALDRNGDFLIVDSSNGISRIDAITGQVTSVFNDSFFNPDDIVVSANGDIYVTEFFGGLGRVSPSGNFSTIGNFDTDQFDHVVIGEDGFLFTTPTFGSEILRINPATGASELLVDGGFSFIDDLEVGLDGNLLLSASIGSVDGIFSIDPVTGDFVNLITDPALFSPSDITVFRGLNEAIPEPGVLPTLIVFSAILAARRRGRPVSSRLRRCPANMRE